MGDGASAGRLNPGGRFVGALVGSGNVKWQINDLFAVRVNAAESFDTPSTSDPDVNVIGRDATGNLFTGIAWLSISQWGLRIGHEISDQLPDPANLPWAIAASLVVTEAGVWFAGDRLRSFSLRGED